MSTTRFKAQPNFTRTVKFAVGIVGLVAALITIYNFLPTEKEVRLVPDAVKPSSPDTFVLNPDAAIPTRPIVRPSVTLSGSVASTRPVYIVTAAFEAEANAELRAPSIVILANDVSGGRLDATGSAGADGQPIDRRGAPGGSGADGSNGGRIFVAGARVTNTVLDASGGNGGSGADGQQGRNGRGGKCDGFGGWVGASDGGPGGRGGNAGNGGHGGDITLIVASEGFRGPEPVVDPGQSGNVGRGGSGGRGGGGCSGLGGIQDRHPPGADGDDGSPGLDGRAGKLSSFPLPHGQVRRAVVEVALAVGDPDLANPQTIEAVIQRLTSSREFN